MTMKLEKRYVLRNQFLYFCIGLLLLQNVLIAVCDDDISTTPEAPESESEIPSISIFRICNSQRMGSEIKSSMPNMLKYMDKCDKAESEKWRKSWFNSSDHSFTADWHGKVCNFFILQQCNGTHCVCGDKATFGSDLEYTPRSSKQTCLAKENEPCSNHEDDPKKDLKVTKEGKKQLIVLQYVVPPEGWGTFDCTPKVDLECIDENHWCKPVADDGQKRVYHTRCVLKEFSSDISGQERFHFSFGLALLLLITAVIGIYFQK